MFYEVPEHEGALEVVYPGETRKTLYLQLHPRVLLVFFSKQDADKGSTKPRATYPLAGLKSRFLSASEAAERYYNDQRCWEIIPTNGPPFHCFASNEELNDWDEQLDQAQTAMTQHEESYSHLHSNVLASRSMAGSVGGYSIAGSVAGSVAGDMGLTSRSVAGSFGDWNVLGSNRDHNVLADGNGLASNRDWNGLASNKPKFEEEKSGEFVLLHTDAEVPRLKERTDGTLESPNSAQRSNSVPQRAKREANRYRKSTDVQLMQSNSKNHSDDSTYQQLGSSCDDGTDKGFSGSSNNWPNLMSLLQKHDGDLSEDLITSRGRKKKGCCVVL